MKELLPICVRDRAKIALLFQNYRTFTLILDPRARQWSENPTLGATRMCESPGVARGDGPGLGLTDTLALRQV